ncbi:hypothetical protein [Rhizobium leguminosarum]|jgi:hypothetical protein
MTPAVCVAFTAGAAFKFRQLEDVLSEHLKDNDGEILPHLLMADYCRLVERVPDDEWVRSFLAYLEDNFLGQSEWLTELISVSFVEQGTDFQQKTRGPPLCDQACPVCP